MTLCVRVTYHLLMNREVQLSLAALGTLHHRKPCSDLSRMSALLRKFSQVVLVPHSDRY